VDEFSFGDQEGHVYVPAPCGDCVKESLQFADVAPVGGRGYCDRDLVDVRDDKSSRDRHV